MSDDKGSKKRAKQQIAELPDGNLSRNEDVGQKAMKPV
jgi:hypothetical protein